MKQLNVAALAAGAPPPPECDHSEVITELAKRLEHVRSVLLAAPAHAVAPWIVRDVDAILRGDPWAL